MAKKKTENVNPEQDMLFEFVQRLKDMPADKREEVLALFGKLDSLLNGDAEDEELDEDDGWGEEEESDPDDYQHYIQRPEVRKFTLRVTIKDHKPAIYRKFSVPSNISLRHLSELLIQLMGWSGGHLNQFRRRDDYYAPAYQRRDEMPVFFGPSRNFSQEDYALSDILSEKGKTIEWEYDFGDSWLHDVRLSSIEDYKEGEPLVSFVKGERACPPEDCGGIWGYEELLESYSRFQKYTMHAGRRPSGEELERLEWYGMDGDFDPEDYDTDFAREICGDFCK